MNRIKLALMLASLLLSASSIAGQKSPATGDSDCSYNCVAYDRQGSSLVVTWKGMDGSVEKVFAVQLGKKAKLVKTENISDPSRSLMTTTETGHPYVTVKTIYYYTATEVVLVTTYFSYDGNGNLLDVQVEVKRWSRMEP